MNPLYPSFNQPPVISLYISSASIFLSSYPIIHLNYISDSLSSCRPAPITNFTNTFSPAGSFLNSDFPHEPSSSMHCCCFISIFFTCSGIIFCFSSSSSQTCLQNVEDKRDLQSASSYHLLLRVPFLTNDATSSSLPTYTGLQLSPCSRTSTYTPSSNLVTT